MQIYQVFYIRGGGVLSSVKPAWPELNCEPHMVLLAASRLIFLVKWCWN